jgi:outer membrane protein assembly factor BamA
MSRGAAVVAMLALLTPTARAQEAPPAETIVEIRVHGNHTTPDADVVALTGIAIGQPFSSSLLAEARERLRRSGRFRSTEVRKRYQSIADPSAIVLVILVEEHPGISAETPRPGVLHRFKASTMWLPVLAFEDGYGFTYGARFSVVDALGRQTRVSVPLTWGGDRQASVEVERRFTRGPLTRIIADAGITRREHPALDVGDRRTGAGVRAERAVSSWLRVSARARVADVRFGSIDDQLRSAGVDATLDTRRDPAFPRNAVYALVSLERLWFDHAEDTPRVLTDVRGYLGLLRQVVFVARIQQAWSPHALPLFEQPLLGGAASLRGFRAGYRMGDRLAAASGELRVPITSPLRIARTGVAVFTDAGTTYSAADSLGQTRWDRSVGAGFFVTATVFSARVDVAHGMGAGTRAHLTLGVRF